MNQSTCYEKIARILTPDSDKWLKLAISKDKGRAWLTEVYGNMAADGFRLHHDTTRQFSAPEDHPVWTPEKILQSFQMVLADCNANKILITINRDALILVCLRAIAIGKGPRAKDNFTPPLRLSVNGRLEYQAISEENGETSGYIESGYQHTGDDVNIAVNPRFLAEALAGMQEEVYISLRAHDRPMFITDGQREVVLMPMRVEWPEPITQPDEPAAPF